MYTTLNEGEIGLGLKFLTKLRNDNMNNSYFHEALVRVEKQILDKVAELHGVDDGGEGEYFLEGKMPKPLKVTETLIDNGLARSNDQKAETVSELKGRISRKDRRKLIKKLQKGEKDKKDSKEVASLDFAEADAPFKIGRKRKGEVDELEMMDYNMQESFLIQDCRLATLKSNTVDSASHYLRLLLVDTLDYFNDLSEDDRLLFEEAVDYYKQKEYNRCANKLEPIVTNYPGNFDAQLLLGDAFYRMGLDSPTYQRYTFITQEWPDRPEGYERLSKYHVSKGKFKDAAKSIIEAILVYPEVAYWRQLGLILSKSGRKFDPRWISREVYPIKTDKNYEEIMADEKWAWLEYQKAKAVLYSYTSENGLLRTNEISALPYIELYGWYTMLVRSEKPGEKINFAFARSMNKMGFIDCYTLISLFHHDVYDQFKDLVKNNPKKVREYFYVLMNWEREEFDQYRVGEEKEKVEEAKKKAESEKKNK